MPAGSGRTQWPESGQVELGLRPEAIAVQHDGVSDASPSSAVLDAQVRRLEFNGPEVLATLSLGPHRLVARLPASLPIPGPAASPGEPRPEPRGLVRSRQREVPQAGLNAGGIAARLSAPAAVTVAGLKALQQARPGLQINPVGMGMMLRSQPVGTVYLAS